MHGDDSYSELPPQAASSMPPFPHTDTHRFNEVMSALQCRLARVARPMLHIHWSPEPHSRSRAPSTPPVVWTPWDGLLHVDDDDDAYGGGRDGDLYVDDSIGVDGDGGGFGAVPALGVAVVSLPERTVGENEAKRKECAVCLEGYEVGDVLRTMPCSHSFHEGCIFGWLRVSRLCPLCRFALPAETDEEDGQG